MKFFWLAGPDILYDRTFPTRVPASALIISTSTHIAGSTNDGGGVAVEHVAFISETLIALEPRLLESRTPKAPDHDTTTITRLSRDLLLDIIARHHH